MLERRGVPKRGGLEIVLERREPGKKVVKMVAGGKILEVEEDPGAQKQVVTNAMGCPGTLASGT